ncbi:MAG: hypothetical protein P9M15_07045 [Candidatus Electryoneaceae bacterium]|nr:hypothetical protein [Candidatus Electryoneaceae bacterium]
MFTHLNRQIDRLSLDHQRGAAEIVEDATKLLLDIVQVGIDDPDDPSEAEALWNRAIRRLARGQPSMAPVLNLQNRACLAIDTSMPDDPISSEDPDSYDWDILSQTLQGFQESRKNQKETMIEKINELPHIDGTLLTFSNSSTISQVIIACYQLGFPKNVICSEGRPMMEGVMMARKLRAAGIPVTLFTDAALMSRIIEVDAVWVGGDAFSQQGLTNKVGSRALAMLAQERRIPFISLMMLDKFLAPELLPFLGLLPQNPREIAGNETKGLDVINEYYENIPSDLVSYVFTEQGLAAPNEMLKFNQLEKVSPLFQRLVQE